VALCRAGDEVRRIDMLLVGRQPVGTWLLTVLNTAREVITPETAQQINDALQALHLTLQGDQQVDHLFADLNDREPELPPCFRDGLPESK